MNRRRFLGVAALVPLAPVLGMKVIEGFLSRAMRPEPKPNLWGNRFIGCTLEGPLDRQWTTLMQATMDAYRPTMIENVHRQVPMLEWMQRRRP